MPALAEAEPPAGDGEPVPAADHAPGPGDRRFRHNGAMTTSDDPLAGTDAARRTMKQRMLDGDLYRAEGPELAAAHHRAMELQARYNATAAA